MFVDGWKVVYTDCTPPPDFVEAVERAIKKRTSQPQNEPQQDVASREDLDIPSYALARTRLLQVLVGGCTPSPDKILLICRALHELECADSIHKDKGNA